MVEESDGAGYGVLEASVAIVCVLPEDSKPADRGLPYSTLSDVQNKEIKL